eukprot:TRINITY_DN463_c0_g3_i2.p1 TRINITY_DN463_c0_g3~~TRINITY_DN463_c0_g3_i2.p1  ORF type:complete len:777 (-),score=138.65 TRINITY_DN463_c0_g3_i2:549-2879(-)
MLELNDQPIKGGHSKLLTKCAEGLLFGAIPRCTKCGENAIICIDGVNYKCNGDINGWEKCNFKSGDLIRNDWIIPDDTSSKYLQDFVFVKRKPVQKVIYSKGSSSTSSESTTTTTGSKKKVKGEREVVKDTRLLFDSIIFCLAGTLSRSHRGIRALILSHGGGYSYNVGEHITYLISSKSNFLEKKGKVKCAEQLDIAVLEEEFIYDSIKQRRIVDETLYHLGGKIKSLEWKSVSSDDDDDDEEEHDEGDEGSKTHKKKKLVVKGHGAVDPDSELSKKGHVLEYKGDVYSATLNISDIVSGTNSFYILQLIEHDSQDEWYIYRKWGRVGTDIGSDKLEEFTTRARAIHQFKRLYLDKTGNEWEDRNNFVKKPGKFYPVLVDLGVDDDDEDDEDEDDTIFDTKSTSLDRRVAELVSLIFDIKAMKRTLKELEIDTKKMPLGKLSRNQLLDAYSTLTRIQDILTQGDENNLGVDELKSQIIAANNKFYTLIPHSVGISERVPLIDNKRLLDKKIEMLDSLLDIQIASKVLKDKSSKISGDPLLHHYKKLDCECTPVEKSDKLFQMIVKYVKNTHASTHDWYELEVLEVFKLYRESENIQYESFSKKIQNKQLLWHGSRLTNFAGILSQGLRIAPPEAPKTGYMFGKGIYFADLVSKSANYCHPTPQNPVALLLLNEVALGNMLELTASKYITKLPSQYSSVKGVGKSGPDPNQVEPLVEDSNVSVPLGKIVPCTKDGKILQDSELLYHEYIVYNTQQTRMRFLLKVQFNFSKNYKPPK